MFYAFVSNESSFFLAFYIIILSITCSVASEAQGLISGNLWSVDIYQFFDRASDYQVQKIFQLRKININLSSTDIFNNDCYDFDDIQEVLFNVLNETIFFS